MGLQEEVITEVRLQRSLAEHHKRGRKLGKMHQKSSKKQKKKQERKSKRRGHKPAKRKFMSGDFDPKSEFEFRACDYLDLVEVGYRQNSSSNCSPGDKFIFKAVKGLRRQFLVTQETNIIVL